jgi:excisionase family DNA binding protein
MLEDPTFQTKSGQRLFLDKLTKLAAGQFGLTPEEVKSPDRGREDRTFCRWFVWRISKESGYTNKQLGKYFSRDHSTICYGASQLAFMLGCYPEWREEWNIFYKTVRTNMKTKYLTRKHTASRMAVSDRSIDRWIRDGRIHAVKIGRSVRIAEASVDKLIADCTV